MTAMVSRIVERVPAIDGARVSARLAETADAVASAAGNLSSEKIVPSHLYVISRVSIVSSGPACTDHRFSRFVQLPSASNSYSFVDSRLPSREISLPFKSKTAWSIQIASSSPHSISASTLSAK